MDKIEYQSFIIGEWHISPAESLVSSNDVSIRIEPKAMEVLVYLASRSGEVISRDELERDVWHGALVGYDAVTSSITKIRKALRDNTKHPRIIVTVPKRGYQLILPVQSDSDDIIIPRKSRGPRPDTPVRPWQKSDYLVPVLAGIVLLALFVIFTLLPNSESRIDYPSIIVLPIENLDKSGQHDVFLGGITEDLITDLSRLSRLVVMASNTSLQYKNRHVTNKELVEELGINYILKGSARRNGNVMRINMQLIDASQGVNIWAQRYDSHAEGIFELQDVILSNIVDKLAINQSTTERQNSVVHATNNLKAYELFLEGQRLSRIQTKQANQQARELYKLAIVSDPDYGRAYGALAYIHATNYRRGWTDSPVETLDRALELARQGIKLNSSIPQTYWSLGYVYFMRKEHDKAEQAAARSVEIAPNFADGYGLLALINNYLGNPKKALSNVTKGMQLNPYYTWDYLYNQGLAFYSLNRYKEAIAALEMAQQRNENVVPIKLVLAASFESLNRHEDAEWTISELLISNPTVGLKHTEKTIPIVNPQLKQKFLEDLRKAGLPE